MHAISHKQCQTVLYYMLLSPCLVPQSVGCGLVLCPPNHALVEEKVPGECCPNRTCVPVTCEVDGVTYKAGEPIPDDDPCKSW